MKCFVIIPFLQPFDDVYDAIRLAVDKGVAGEPVECYRLDENKSAGRITDRLLRELGDAAVCVADITGRNANVMWEVGYAMALAKPTLLVSQDRSSDLPFDIKDMQTIFYQRDALAETLRAPLSESFRATLGSFELRTTKVRQVQVPKTHFVVAVTGSMNAHRERTRRRIELLLRPYLSETTHWLVGSWGTADEVTIEFLAERKQHVTVVGHNSVDISPLVLRATEQHHLHFLSAKEEQLPRGLSGAANRDWLFLTRADLTVLLWDGHSEGIGGLLKLYRTQGRDHIVGFV